MASVKTTQVETQTTIDTQGQQAGSAAAPPGTQVAPGSRPAPGAAYPQGQGQPPPGAGPSPRQDAGLEAGRPSPAARRAGYLAVIMVSAALVCVIDWYPGWHTAAFLTLAAGAVIGLVNLLLVALILVNLVYLAFDPPWMRLAGDLACAIIGLITAIQIWQVFPFAVAQPWVSVTRVLLVMAMAGTFAAIVVQLAKLIRIIARR